MTRIPSRRNSETCDSSNSNSLFMMFGAMRLRSLFQEVGTPLGVCRAYEQNRQARKSFRPSKSTGRCGFFERSTHRNTAQRMLHSRSCGPRSTTWTKPRSPHKDKYDAPRTPAYSITIEYSGAIAHSRYAGNLVCDGLNHAVLIVIAHIVKARKVDCMIGCMTRNRRSGTRTKNRQAG